MHFPANVRTRWAAIGAAIAVTIGAGGVGLTRAAEPDGAAVFVPIAPCRLFDYRPGEGVSQRATPIGEAETVVQQITGAVGACNIPASATAVSMNVTIAGPTAASNLRLFPADVPVPNASNLNWRAGSAEIPNKVDVKLSSTGAIGIYNAYGSVFVLADATGYYTRTAAADLQAQISALQTLVQTQGAQIAALESSLPFAAHAEGYQTVPLPINGGVVAVRTLTVTAPVAGTFTFNANAWSVSDATYFIGCGIKPIVSLYQDDPEIQRTQGGINGAIAMTRAVDVAAGEVITRHLVCYNVGQVATNPGTIKHSSLTAIFTPAP